MTAPDLPPMLQPKAHNEPSVFHVENLLREARRQRQLENRLDPDVCLLDPDGDVVRHLRARGTAIRDEHWACYHSELWLTAIGGREIGIRAMRRRGAICGLGRRGARRLRVLALDLDLVKGSDCPARRAAVLHAHRTRVGGSPMVTARWMPRDGPHLSPDDPALVATGRYGRSVDVLGST